MKAIYTLLILLIPFVGFCQQTYVPDDNFEQALIGLGYDDVLDDYVLTENISNIEYLDVNGYGIYDLTGIEDFLMLTYLNCSTNFINSIDVSNLIFLEQLNFTFNPISFLNISNTQVNIEIDFFDLYSQISSLELIANDIEDGYINIQDIVIENIDIDGSSFEQVILNNNDLNSLNLSNCQIQNLVYSNNNISYIELSENNLITNLNTNNNNVDSIKIFNCYSLQSINIQEDNIKSIEIIYTDSINYFNNLLIESNLYLEKISLKNIGIESLTNGYVAFASPFLNEFIFENVFQIDLFIQPNVDVAILPSIYIQNSTLPNTYISDVNLLNFNCINSDLNYLHLNNSFTNLFDLNNTKTWYFLATNNNIDTLIINPELSQCYVENNDIEFIDLSTSDDLESLDISDNNLIELNLENASNLNFLSCDNNYLTCIDLSSCFGISSFSAISNNITSINTINNNYSNFEYFNLSNNEASCIQVEDLNYSNSNPNWIIDDNMYYSLNCNYSDQCFEMINSSWNCVNDACVDPMDGTGIYGSLEECEANCSSVEPTWDCNNDYACVELSDGSGNFQSLEECEANCNPIADSWNCVNDACVDPMDGTGIYGSLEECESNCNIIEVTFDCISAGICMEVMDGTGEFSSIDDCLTNCNPITDSWNCVNDACVDPLDGSGEFSTLNDCEQVCQNISSISENLIDVNIYPNPSSNIFNLEFNSVSETEILVTNVLGEQVYFESTQSSGEFNTKIDLSNFSKGVYNLTLKTTDGISNHKLILQ